MNKAIFLDRDGTINVEKNYLYKIDDFEFLPGVIDALRQLQQAGFLLIIITNQSGIGRGYYSEEDFKKLNNWMVSTLKEKGVIITDVYYCPHLPNAKLKEYRKDCNCRKPKLGMFRQAVRDHNVCLNESYAVGDKIRDCAICKSSACKGFLIGDNEETRIIDEVKKGIIRNVSFAPDLLSFSKLIIKES